MSYTREDLAVAIRGSSRQNEQQAEINHWIAMLSKAMYSDYDYVFPREVMLVTPISERTKETHIRWSNRADHKDYRICVITPTRTYTLYQYGSNRCDAIPLELVTPVWNAMPSFITGICKEFPEMGRTIDLFIAVGKS